MTRTKKSALLVSVLAIVLCAAVIAGATFALFTDKSDLNIAVTSGDLDVTAQITSTATYSMGEKQEGGAFENGGKLTVDGGKVSLDRMTPGDKAVIELKIENNSDIAVKQRFIMSAGSASDSALLDQMLFGVSGKDPESYEAAQQLLTLCGYTLKDVGNLSQLPQRLKEVGEEQAAQACGIGVPTVRDIVSELQKPGRDPRDQLPPPLLRTDVMELADLKPGMKLSGTVRNVVDFGAFVDIGVHQDGLVHVSQITDRYIRHPSEALAVGDIVEVTVLSVDEGKKRISLTMRDQENRPPQQERERPAKGAGR